MDIAPYTALFTTYLQKQKIVKPPHNLYEPIAYILQLGGKRLRPALTLLSAEAFGVKPEKALDVAVAVEIFHNFTLLHDDIMDEAPIRRGQMTVHKKWSVNTGILSGDVMLVKAYQFLEKYKPPVFKDLVCLFSKMAVKVCEGQQYDMDFETCTDVTISDYLKMIEYKTSVLLGIALQMGAIVAKASKKKQQHIYDFGIQLGLAFQLQDDYLDTYGDAKTFGKKIGGDILEKKKTWLFLKYMEIASATDRKQLLQIYSETTKNEEAKIETVKKVFTKYHIDVLIKKEITNYSQKALKILDKLKFEKHPKKILTTLLKSLEKRIK